MMDESTVLEVRNLSKSFPGVQALRNVQFELKRGEVHALIGENGAGKSTLMKILLGIYEPDEGEIYFRGERVSFHEPFDALRAGISMIHQEISLIPNMDVAENIWVGREKEFTRCGLIDRKMRLKRTRQLLDELQISLDPQAQVNTMSIAQMQLVELVRAVSYHADVIIMDEPTSALTDTEVQLLYRIVRQVAASGVSVVFISHKLEEIFEICDRVTVMRDGAYIGTHLCSEIDIPRLIGMIVGREMTDMYPASDRVAGRPVLEARRLTRNGVFSDVSFELHEGEIVGMCGLMGAGRTEIARAVFGIDRLDSGEILINGKAARILSPTHAIAHNMGMVTEDRLRLGIMHSMSVKLNITLVALKQFCRGGLFIRKKQEAAACSGMTEELDIKISGQDQLVGLLSGGNQQKVILGKWLMNCPDILILDEPTRGIDVGSKSEIHHLIAQLAQKGMAILMISSELPEILGMSDRILVVRDGTIVAEHRRGEADQELLMQEEFGA